MTVDRARVLVLGGVRSGKSRRASAWASHFGGAVSFVATAEPFDAELRERIAAHQRERPAAWGTLEVPRRLAQTLERLDQARETVLIDCLTLWLTNLLVGEDEAALSAEVDSFLRWLATSDCHVVMVANEAGLGLIGATPLSRRFLDIAGEVQQRVAARCDRVELMVAGLPLVVKGADLQGPQ